MKIFKSLAIIKSLMIISIAFLICLSLTRSLIAQGSNLIVVATDATYKHAQEWIDFLNSKEVPLKHVTPSEFSEHKNENFIVLMGGMDEPDGISDIAKEVLSKEEYDWVSEMGNNCMYLKSDVWTEEQYIIVFIGSDRDAAETARVESKEKWLDYIPGWFDIELSQQELYGY